MFPGMRRFLVHGMALPLTGLLTMAVLTVSSIAGATPSIEQLGSDIVGTTPDDTLGTSVSLSSDGNIVAIGASQQNNGGSGYVRIYEWDSTSSSWTQLGADLEGEAGGDWFGRSVSLSSDGTIVAIGAPFNDAGELSNQGHVRIYEWDGEAWTQIGDDIDGEATNDRSGDSVSLNSDGTIVAIGAPQNDGDGSGSGNEGHVRIYEWDSTSSSWTQIGDDIDGGADGDLSAESVSLNSDGTIVAIGAAWHNGEAGSYSGRARIYEWNGTSWTQLGADLEGEAAYANYGNSVSLNYDGDRVAVGAPYGIEVDGDSFGQVHIFEWNGTSWTQLGTDIDSATAWDEFGANVFLSADGSTVAGSALSYDAGSGRVGVFRLSEPDDSGSGESAGSSSSRPRLRTVTLDPAGGVCGENSSPWTVTQRRSVTLPTDCTRDGHTLLGWTRNPANTTPEYLIHDVMPRSGTVTAVWGQLPNPPSAVYVLRDFFCYKCGTALVIWQTTDTDTTGFTVSVDDTPTPCTPFNLDDWWLCALSGLDPNQSHTFGVSAQNTNGTSTTTKTTQ